MTINTNLKKHNVKEYTEKNHKRWKDKNQKKSEQTIQYTIFFNNKNKKSHNER